MIWKKITIDTNVEAADIVASVLFDNGIIGAEIEDNQNLSDNELKQMYVDIPKVNVDDGMSKVSFYVSIGDKVENNYKNVDNSLVDNSYMKSTDNIFSKSDFDSIIKNIIDDLNEYKEFMDMGKLTITETEMDDEVFLNKWKENFKSINIGDISIIPSFERNFDDNKINVFIEPGNAFGTGQHATTKLCVKELKKAIKNNNVKLLDIGSGSGILSIVANKLMAKQVVAIDIDNNVEFNLIENLKLNKITNYRKVDKNDSVLSNYNDVDFIYSFGNILTDEWLKKIVSSIKYDVIVANILAPVIISLIEKADIISYLKENGILILSGIIKEKEQDVIDTLKNNIKVKKVESNNDGDWVSITCMC